MFTANTTGVDMNARRTISLILGAGFIGAMGIIPLATSASAEPGSTGEWSSAFWS